MKGLNTHTQRSVNYCFPQTEKQINEETSNNQYYMQAQLGQKNHMKALVQLMKSVNLKIQVRIADIYTTHSYIILTLDIDDRSCF